MGFFPQVSSGSFLTGDWGGHQLPALPAGSVAPPLSAEISPYPMETRALQGDHLVWPTGISHAKSITEPGAWCGDQGWTTASGTVPLAPASGCSWERERCQPLLCLGMSGASPNVDFSMPDRFPQIIQLASELEFNLGSEPVVSCVATGNPLPASDSVELRKADGTVLKVPPPCPCPTTIPMLPAPSKAPVSPLVCWAASSWDRELGG